MTCLAEVWEELHAKGYRIARCEYVKLSSEELEPHGLGAVSLRLDDSIDDVFLKHAKDGHVCLTPETIKLILFDFPAYICPNNPTERLFPQNYFIKLDMPQRQYTITEPATQLQTRLPIYSDITTIFRKYGWTTCSALG